MNFPWVTIGLDDGNNLFSGLLEKRVDFGNPPIENITTTTRKARINLIVCTQTPHQLGSSIHSNSTIKIVMSLVNGKDIKHIIESMGVFVKEQQEYFYRLQPRQVIIKNSIRFPEPILGLIPELPVSREVSDQEVFNSTQRILSGLPPVIPRYEPKTEAKQEAEKKHISEQTRQFLMIVNLYQYKVPMTEIYKVARLSAGVGTRVSQYCEKKSFIKILQVKFGRGRPKYPILLPEAYKALEIKEKKFYGKGAGYEHVLYQHLIARHFEDYKPVIELNRNGKFIDVGFYYQEQLICIEVAMTSVNEKVNIEKDFNKANTSFVIVACLDEKVRTIVQEYLFEIPEQLRNKTKVVLLSELLGSKPDEFLNNLF